MAERFKALDLKSSEGEILPWVRIPPSPPNLLEVTMLTIQEILKRYEEGPNFLASANIYSFATDTLAESARAAVASAAFVKLGSVLKQYDEWIEFFKGGSLPSGVECMYSTWGIQARKAAELKRVDIDSACLNRIAASPLREEILYEENPDWQQDMRAIAHQMNDADTIYVENPLWSWASWKNWYLVHGMPPAGTDDSVLDIKSTLCLMSAKYDLRDNLRIVVNRNDAVKATAFVRAIENAALIEQTLILTNCF